MTTTLATTQLRPKDVRVIHRSDKCFDEVSPTGLKAWIDQNNRFIAPERLRAYQLEILTQGCLSYYDELDQRSIRCIGTIYYGIKAFAWLFRSSKGPLWLTSGDPSTGFELVGIYLPNESIYLRFEKYESSLSARQQLEEILSFGEIWDGDEYRRPNEQPVLIAGHENFAHFMWNELPALIEAERFAPWSTKIYATWEPIAPLEKLIDLPIKAALTRIDANTLTQPRSFHFSTLFAIGSTRMTLVTKKRILRNCTENHIVKSSIFVVWLSLRKTHRYPTNQVKVFAEFLNALSKLEFPIEVILDGYSIASDIDHPGRHHRDLQFNHSREASKLADEIINLLTSEARQKLLVTDGTRLSLPESIGLASRADFYICHHGTQQHKIGWIYSTPGIIHAPPAVLRSDPAGWTAHQSEGSSLPIYVPYDCVEDDFTSSDDVSPPSANYRFSDTIAFVDFAVTNVAKIAASRAQ